MVLALSRPALRRWAAVGVVGGSASAAFYHYYKRSKNDDNDSLLLPTLQATARVGRLMGTCVMMVADYKTAGLIGQSKLIKVEEEKSEEEEYWEEELAARQQVLDQAQEQYSTNTLPGMDIADRVVAKKKEKAAMQQAAERVAEAEEKLRALGRTTAKSAIHAKAAQRLLGLCHTNRGVYIKVGQHLANLDYLIPVEYIETLSALYNDNPVTSYADVCRVIEQDLGAHPNELFEDFSVEPIASASLAQVHTAYSKEEPHQKLAIKVQHRGLRETSRGDIFNLVTAVRLAERLFADDFTFGWIADEIAPNLPKELDFQNEGRNAEKAAAHLATTGLNCVIPKILWEHTSPRVLTMEFEEGFKVTDTVSIEKVGLKRRDVAKLVSSVFASQVFESGHVHCDPHEANVLLRPHKKSGKPEMVLVDHGLYKSLDADFRRNYAALWKSLMLADVEGIRQACVKMGIEKKETYALFAAVLTARPFDEIIERSKKQKGKLLLHRPTTDRRSRGGRSSTGGDQAIIRGYAQRFLPNIVSMLSVIPRQMLLLLKMNDCLRHIDFSLGCSQTNTLLVTGHWAARAIYKDSCTTTATWLERFRAWWSYFKVELRIHVHEASLWWLARKPATSALL